MKHVKQCKNCGKEYAPDHEGNGIEELTQCDACGGELVDHSSHSEFSVEDADGGEHAIEKGLRKVVGKPKNS